MRIIMAMVIHRLSVICAQVDGRKVRAESTAVSGIRWYCTIGAAELGSVVVMSDSFNQLPHASECFYSNALLAHHILLHTHLFSQLSYCFFSLALSLSLSLSLSL
jgi:hypothetical protein